MSDTIWATILGAGIGIIASITAVWITGYFENQKWKKTQKVNNLKEKKRKLEKRFQEARELLLKNMSSGAYDINMLANIVSLFPTKVLQTIQTFTAKKNPDNKEINDSYIKICVAMEDSLSDIDDEIEKIIG